MRPAPELIIVRQTLDLATAIDELVLISEASAASEYRGFITWIPLTAGG
jgi:hypothetical protein